MCGISAIHGDYLSQVDEELVPMLMRISHRGDSPLELGHAGNSIFGANRLTIVDRKNGKQPMANERRTVFSVFNGEIYNYKELREELAVKGHSFRTDCDTEVLVHLYEEYGTSFLDKLDGKFAFYLYDIEKDTHLVARDPFGIKPLYFARKNNKTYFASEAKAFLDIRIERVYELLPGHFMVNNRISSYYEAKDEENCNSLHDTIKYVKELVKKSIAKRVQTDLPIGVLFGGGIDSSIVLLNVIKFHEDVTAFSIGFRDSEDVMVARKLCTEMGINHVIYEPHLDEIFSLISQVVYQTESFEPNMIRGSILSYLLCREVKKYGIKVLLCGEGADEIFAGYGDFLLCGEDRVKSEIKLFLKDLYRTQLQRVDRTSMAFAEEVRVPFLDKKLVEYVLTIPPRFKVSVNLKGHVTTKHILREAFQDELPEYICQREKVTLMSGAGLGDVASTQ